uniref:Uncharacterized protein n=1 Tax=Rhizophora mucronata TaxID=61149 RepID=A0A2P2PA94_RHIMU
MEKSELLAWSQWLRFSLASWTHLGEFSGKKIYWTIL